MAVLTYMVGNGFDINLGLKTTYSDFIESYLRTESKNEQIDAFKRTIRKEIINDPATWADAEIAFGKLTTVFSDKPNPGLHFNMCQEDFCNALSEYLNKQQSRLTDELLNENQGKINSINKALEGIADALRPVQKDTIMQELNKCGQGFDIYVLDFNYTNTVERILSASKSPWGIRPWNHTNYDNRMFGVTHPHGTVDQDMVFGVNDTSQISCLEIFKDDEINLNAFIKEKTNETNGEYLEEKTVDILSNSDAIYIYGMSLGETDKRWWERIIKLMKERQHLCVIIYDYKAPLPGVINTGYERRKREIQDLMLSYNQSLSAEEGDKLRERLFIDPQDKFKPLQSLVPDPLKAAYVERAKKEMKIQK